MTQQKYLRSLHQGYHNSTVTDYWVTFQNIKDPLSRFKFLYQDKRFEICFIKKS